MEVTKSKNTRWAFTEKASEELLNKLSRFTIVLEDLVRSTNWLFDLVRFADNHEEFVFAMGMIENIFATLEQMNGKFKNIGEDKQTVCIEYSKEEAEVLEPDITESNFNNCVLFRDKTNYNLSTKRSHFLKLVGNLLNNIQALSDEARCATDGNHYVETINLLECTIGALALTNKKINCPDE